MEKFIRIGVDLAKNYFQIHALASEGAAAATRKLTRVKMREFFSQIEPGVIGMEACGSAHYWARELRAMGHEVLLMPPAYTKPYVHICQGRPFSSRAPLSMVLLPPRITVLSAVGIIRRNIWSEAQALQCPQRADVQ